MGKLLAFSLVLVFSIGLAFAATCDIKVAAKSTKELLSSIPSIDGQLNDCSPDVPSPLNKLIKNGNLFVQISDDEDFYITITNKEIVSVSLGVPDRHAFKILMSSCQLNNVLKSDDRIGSFASYYLSGSAKLSGGGLMDKIKLFFVGLFGKGAIKDSAVEVEECDDNIPSGKPENCYEAYMQGAEEYQYAKAEWDRRLQETGGICQTQNAAPPKGGNCVYLFEQIKNNDKKWLCWYKP